MAFTPVYKKVPGGYITFAEELAGANSHGEALLDCEVGVPGYFPKEAIGISEVARVAAPENLLAWLHEGRTGIHCLLESSVDFFRGSDIVRLRFRP